MAPGAAPWVDILSRFDPSTDVTAWILGSALRFASLRPRMTKAWLVARSLPSIIIGGYTALVDPAAFGWNMVAIATIRLGRQNEDEIVMFEEAIRGWDEVLECHLVTGSRDYVLKVVTESLERYERFIKEKIARLKCVASIETSFVMNTIKERRL